MRRVLQFTSVVLIVVALYTGWVFFLRWRTGRKAQQQKTEQQSEDARKVLNTYGGERLTILHFSITPAVVSPGEPATLCYGVSNAKAVKIEPALTEETWPSMSRCIQVSVRRDTTFKLTAQDAAGHGETALALLKVR